MNRKQVLAGSALLLVLALSMPRAWSHGDAQAIDELLAAPRAAKTSAAPDVARETCTGPSPQAGVPAARPGCVAQPG